MKEKYLWTSCSIGLLFSSAMFPSELFAQDDSFTGAATADEVRSGNDIIVTARKRQESILNVPVVATALTQEQIERRQVTDISDLQQMVPGLVIGHAQGPIATMASIRGVGSISQDQGVDSSVSLNIDGLQLGNNVAFQSGLFDLAQIEVLKGPQALFYGKSSPAGVISLRTADPTDDLELITRLAYEFQALNPRGELILSGPVSDTLGLRLAALYSAAEGYFHNTSVPAPGTGGVRGTRRLPNVTNLIVRGTAMWEPTDRFSARLKANYVRDRSIQPQSSQLASCPQGPDFAPSGVPFIVGDDCKLNRNIGVAYLDKDSFPGLATMGVRSGVPKMMAKQAYGMLELNYRLSDSLELTSNTGYYDLKQFSVLNATNSSGAGPALGVTIDFKRRDFTQELRLNSNLSSPLNFTFGAFYQDGQIDNNPALLGNAAYGLPALLSNVREVVDIETYSLFGQLRWQILPTLELAGGGRWTDETRNERAFSLITGTSVEVFPLVPRLHSSNFAPEFTVTFRPTDDLTIFGSYKRAYKSGSFSLGGIPETGVDNSFGDERVEGGEFGVKGRFFDRQLSFSIAGYGYWYKGLQVGAIEPSRGNITATRTLNAGAAKSYGVDFDAAFRPHTLPELSVRTALNWNKARYTELTNIPCWGGQTISAGCNLVPGANIDPATGLPLFTAQDLSGTPMVRAPEWQATFGFDWEVPLGNDNKVTLSSNVSYSSEYVSYLGTGRPNNDHIRPDYAKFDLGLTFQGADDRWEVALIGKNITDKITAGTCAPSNAANGGIFGGEITGGLNPGVAGPVQVTCNTDVGRQVWLRFTNRF